MHSTMYSCVLGPILRVHTCRSPTKASTSVFIHCGLSLFEIVLCEYCLMLCCVLFDVVLCMFDVVLFMIVNNCSVGRTT